MGTFKTIEDVLAWQAARSLCSRVYDVTGSQSFSKDFELRNQARRSAISIISNIAEGFERDGNAEFAQFLSVAKASCGELKSQLCVALDQGYITTEAFEECANTINEVSSMIYSLMHYLKTSNRKGLKFDGPRKATND